MRLRLGIRTQGELAQRVGVSWAAVSAWECNARYPSYEVCARLLALGATVEELFDIKPPVAPVQTEYHEPSDLRSALQVMEARLQKLEKLAES